MAATLRIDTLNFVRRLTGAGMERQMAEAIVEGLAEADTSELATKSDVTACRSELQAEIIAFRNELKADISTLRSELKSDIAALRTELKTDIAALRTEVKTEIADNRAELFRFMMVQAVTIVGLTVALIKLLP